MVFDATAIPSHRIWVLGAVPKDASHDQQTVDERGSNGKEGRLISEVRNDVAGTCGVVRDRRFAVLATSHLLHVVVGVITSCLLNLRRLLCTLQ